MRYYDPRDDLGLTPEEQNAQYLQQNPDIEIGLWQEWVGVVCDRQKINPPTAQEWARLKARFHHGKAPVDSVAELKLLRGIS
jgi:hypothetical protein